MYKFLDHTADVLFEATGKTLSDLCTNCALALQEIQVKLSTVAPKRKKVVKEFQDALESVVKSI